MSEAEPSYFLRVRGRVTGPHALSQLEVMAKRGGLLRVYEVSQDRVRWSSAGDVAAFAGFWPGSAPTVAVPVNTTDAARTLPVRAEMVPVREAPPSFRSAVGSDDQMGLAGESGRDSITVRHLSRTVGIVAGVLALVVWLFPETRGPVGLEWWWSSFRGNGVFHNIACIMAVPAVVALVLCAVFCQQQGRSYAYLASGAVCTLLVICMAASGWPALSHVVVLLLPLVISVMLCAAWARRLDREGSDDRSLDRGATVLTWLCCAGALSLHTANLARGGERTVSAIAALVFMCLAAITLSVGAGFCWPSQMSQKTWRATLILSGCGLVSLLVAAWCASYGHAASGGIEYAVQRFGVLQDLRALVVLWLGAGLFSMGLWELLFEPFEGAQVTDAE